MCNRRIPSIFRRSEQGKFKTQLNYDKAMVTLNRLKSKKHPPIPSSLEKTRDVLNTKANLVKYGNTLDRKNKFYVDTVVAEAYTFTIFVSFKTVNMIKRYIKPAERRYLLDGTFKIRPKLFYQLLIIAIEYKNDVIIFFCFVHKLSNEFLLYFFFPLLDLSCILHSYDEQIEQVLFICVSVY